MRSNDVKKNVYVYIYIYMLGASAGIYTCFDPLTQRTRVACSWDLRVCVCVCVCVSSFAQTHLYIYIYTRILFGPEAISSVRK